MRRSLNLSTESLAYEHVDKTIVLSVVNQSLPLVDKANGTVQGVHFRDSPKHATPIISKEFNFDDNCEVFNKEKVRKSNEDDLVSTHLLEDILSIGEKIPILKHVEIKDQHQNDSFSQVKNLNF
ncbi:unnamed protein product [Brachionus calyciflorus]|uniref:Uncharacterized protein n=1 Tax=Brachionus calyciflorus TaxID=104777 RepID=A0A813SIP9_9BILA|nr:unnamed protein product [Brachionus calyciflorus]